MGISQISDEILRLPVFSISNYLANPLSVYVYVLLAKLQV